MAELVDVNNCGFDSHLRNNTKFKLRGEAYWLGLATRFVVVICRFESYSVHVIKYNQK